MLISLFFFTNNKIPSKHTFPSSTTPKTLHNIHSAAMKKLYRKKGTVHPTPPLVSDQLAFLPAAILTLAAALSQEDKQVLAYLISCSSSANSGANLGAAAAGGGADHPPCFNCNCFGCYMSYWVRWDSSPNHQLIHEIIDAYEDGLLQLQSKKLEKNKREKRRNKTHKNGNKGSPGSPGEQKTMSEESLSSAGDVSAEHRRGDGGDDSTGEEEEDGGEKGAVRRIVSFLGERIWTTIWT